MKDVNDDILWDADVTASAEILESVVSLGSFRLFHFSSSLSGNAVRRSLCSEETVSRSFISVPSACVHTAFSTETTQTLGVLNRINIVFPNNFSRSLLYFSVSHYKKLPSDGY